VIIRPTALELRRVSEGETSGLSVGGEQRSSGMSFGIGSVIMTSRGHTTETAEAQDQGAPSS
jgi:hypothetical protein